MIPWYFSQVGLRKFQKKPKAKQEKEILNQRQNVNQNRAILVEKADAIKISAKKVLAGRRKATNTVQLKP